MQIISSIKPRENWKDLVKQKTGHCLDLGCGFGADAFWFAEHDWQVDAVDSSNAIKFKHKNINFIQNDLKEINFDNLGKYDFIIACFILHFLEPEYSISLVKKLMSMLNKNGILYIKTFKEFFSQEWQKIFKKTKVYLV